LAFLSVLPLLKLAGDFIQFHLYGKEASPSSSEIHDEKVDETRYSRSLHPLTGLPLHSVYEVESFNMPDRQVDLTSHWQRHSSVDDYARVLNPLDNIPTPVTSEGGDCVTAPLIPLSKRVPRPNSVMYSPYPATIASRKHSRSQTGHSSSSPHQSDDERKTLTPAESRHTSPAPAPAATLAPAAIGSPSRAGTGLGLGTDDEPSTSSVNLQESTPKTVTFDSALVDSSDSPSRQPSTSSTIGLGLSPAVAAGSSSAMATRQATPYRRTSGRHTRTPSTGPNPPPQARSSPAYRGLTRANSPPRASHAIPELTGPYGPFSPMRRGSRGSQPAISPSVRIVSGGAAP